MASIALNYALNNGMTQEQYDQRIFDYVSQNIAVKTPAELRIEMDRLGVSPDDVARATGVSAADVKAQYAEALPQTQAEMIAKAAADKELAGRVVQDTTATQATRDIYNQAAAVSQGLLGPDTGAQAASAAAAAALAASQKAAAEKLAADNATAAAATAAAAAKAKAASDKAAADAAALAASNATAAQKAAADKAAADALAASNAAAAKAAADAKAAAAAQAATDAGLAATAAAAKTAADKAAADAAAIAASNATAAQKAAAAKAAADALAASNAAAAKAAADAAAKAAAAKTTTTTGTNSTGLTYALNNGMTQQQYYKNIFDFYSRNSGLSDSMLRSEMDRLGISPQDVAAATGVTVDSVLSRYNAAKATTPAELAAQKAAQDDLAARTAQWQAQQAKNATDWAAQQKANETAWAAQQAKNAADWAAQQKLTQTAQNAYGAAPMTLGQKFGSYESIPIGAQYNPAVTPGGASPYSMVMGQMTPFQNPYANFVPGTALGGYNPNLYSDIATNNAAAAAAKAAAENQAANSALMMTGGGGDGNSTSAGEGPGGNSGGGEGNGATAGEAGAGYAMGGMVNSLLGPNPAGPDDGMAALDRGEYVIKKSAVNKYGRGLLDMINEGKMPAKKIRSLLD
jgi:hypothetical protein